MRENIILLHFVIFKLLHSVLKCKMCKALNIFYKNIVPSCYRVILGFTPLGEPLDSPANMISLFQI